MEEPIVKLNGKCTLKFDTGSSTTSITIVKKSPKTGKNNADSLIDAVFHFAIMRHGMDKVQVMLTEKFTQYEDKYKSSGLK